MCFTIVMESFDIFLNTNFVALKHCSKMYGVQTGPDEWAIPPRWQSALFQEGQCGVFVIGYRWTTLLGLLLMNAAIFISFFANSLTLLVVGQALGGVPWGFFIANSPAYASEIVPLLLRAACTATLQISWSIGSTIVSPWWLIRRGRKDEALRSIKRLGAKFEGQDQQSLVMMERTVEIEESMGGAPTLLDLLKGTDRRRTIITCLAYASHYFFEQAGISSDKAFQINLITTCLQFVSNVGSWGLTSWFRRRAVFLFVLGICASVLQNPQDKGPISYTVISETSSVCLRALSTAIPMIYLSSRMLNTTGWNLAGKCGARMFKSTVIGAEKNE
ncbi:major facilitator superfamily domain-containing protein [Aspergillus fruticulosus]